MNQLCRREALPQGARFTGRVDQEDGALWALYRTDSGRRIWRVVRQESVSFWEEQCQTN